MTTYRDLGYNSYAEYLVSPHWRGIRSLWEESKLPSRCLACGSSRFQLHHRTYSRLGKEFLLDLVPLCGNCHVAVHKHLKKCRPDLQASHAVMRRAFKWTKSKTLKKFQPISIRNFRWLPVTKKDLVIVERRVGSHVIDRVLESVPADKHLAKLILEMKLSI